MRKEEGYRNYSELTEEDIKIILDDYFSCTSTVKELTNKYKLTKRTLPELFKKHGIKSNRKNRYTLNEDYFEECDTERKAYWLGYLYADGFVGDEHFNNVVFSQKESDGYIIEQFAKDIEFTGKVRLSKKGSGFGGQRQRVISFSSKKMRKDLNALNMFTKKSTTMELLPPIENNLMRHFIRGYFDGDGSAYISVRSYYKDREYKSFYWNIIGTLPFNLKIADFLPLKGSMHDSHTPEMKYYCISANKKEKVSILYHYLYDNATFFLKRKHDIFLQFMGAF